MNPVFDDHVQERLASCGVIVVLIIDRADDAVPLARALVDGGVRAMELTLRTPVAIEALRAIKSEVPEMLAGIGTILTPEQINEVAQAGAEFGVAPGLNGRVLQAAMEAGLSFAPGIVTPTDIEQALEFGCRLLKFFPAELSGGLPYLRSIGAPYAHFDLQYVPLGGVNMSNLREYLADPMIAAVGGTWIAPRDLIRNQRWDEISNNAHKAMEVVTEVRR